MNHTGKNGLPDRDGAYKFICSPEQMFAAGLLAFLASGLFSFLLSKLIYKTYFSSPPPMSLFIVLLAGFLLVLLFFMTLHTKRRIYFALGWAGIFFFTVMNTGYYYFTFHTYGDGDFVAHNLLYGSVYARDLGGTAILDWLYFGIFKCPFISAHVPEYWSSTQAFTAVLSSFLMTGSAVFLLFKHNGENRLQILLPVLTPLYFLFSLGHQEYYPLVAGLYVIFLVYLFKHKAETISPLYLGAALAALPVFYIALAPIALGLMIAFSILFPQKAARLYWATAAFFVIFVNVFWPQGVTSYFISLYNDLNLGHKNILYEPYQNASIDENGICFSFQDAFSWNHIKDLAYMFYWSGMVFLVLIVAAAGLWYKRHSMEHRTYRQILKYVCSADKRIWFALVILGVEAVYFALMMPKYGPRKDIDLFFAFYLTLAFFSGGFLDRLWRDSPFRCQLTFFVVSAYLGSVVVSFYFLAIVGLPPL